MSSKPSIDGVLVQWGERLFYPGNRIVKARTPRLGRFGSKAALIRSRIEATVRRAPQVMVKVTGGGRGMKAIAAHFCYISKNGRLEIEDDRGVVEQGREAMKDIERQWRYGGANIDDVGHRREALNVMLSMPEGTDPQILQRAAREFAKIEFADHRYVMVLHTHQANPHVHLSVKAESKHGERLNPRKADLHRWRETFAERLRSGESTPRRHDKQLVGPFATTRTSGARKRPRRGESTSRDLSAKSAWPPLKVARVRGRPGRSLPKRCVHRRIQRINGSRWPSSAS